MSAAERWAARRQTVINYRPDLQAKMYIGIINKIEETRGIEYMNMTLGQFRCIAEEVVKLTEERMREIA